MYSIHDVFYLLQAVFHKIFRYVIFFCGFMASVILMNYFVSASKKCLYHVLSVICGFLLLAVRKKSAHYILKRNAYKIQLVMHYLSR